MRNQVHITGYFGSGTFLVSVCVCFLAGSFLDKDDSSGNSYLPTSQNSTQSNCQATRSYDGGVVPRQWSVLEWIWSRHSSCSTERILFAVIIYIRERKERRRVFHFFHDKRCYARQQRPGSSCLRKKQSSTKHEDSATCPPLGRIHTCRGSRTTVLISVNFLGIALSCRAWSKAFIGMGSTRQYFNV